MRIQAAAQLTNAILGEEKGFGLIPAKIGIVLTNPWINRKMPSWKDKLISLTIKTAQTTVLFSVIMATGYGIMKTTVPSDAEMRQRIGTNIDSDPVRVREKREHTRLIVDTILENAKSDNPVWDIDW